MPSKVLDRYVITNDGIITSDPANPNSDLVTLTGYTTENEVRGRGLDFAWLLKIGTLVKDGVLVIQDTEPDKEPIKRKTPKKIAEEPVNG